MRKELIAGCFTGLMLLQIAVPLSTLLERESVLKTGAQFKFKTSPVDPYDAFRGRYVALDVEADRAPVPEGAHFKYDQKVYALVDLDQQGFARISGVSIKKPGVSAYLKAKVSRWQGNEVYLDLPIDRYYMEEKSAPGAERVYRKHSRTKVKDAYLLVRIKNGYAVIEGLYIGNMRIEEVIKQDL